VAQGEPGPGYQDGVGVLCFFLAVSPVLCGYGPVLGSRSTVTCVCLLLAPSRVRGCICDFSAMDLFSVCAKKKKKKS
jgi:hypothetical protein